MSAPEPASPRKLDQHDNDLSAFHDMVRGIDEKVEALAARVDEGFITMGQKLDAILAQLGDTAPTAG
jgi:hypothetical protein